MGWSCTKKAGDVLAKWEKFCTEQTGRSNVYIDDKDAKHYFEVSSKEHRDGKITGQIWKFVNESQCVPKSRFTISKDGEVIKAPKFLKDIAKK